MASDNKKKNVTIKVQPQELNLTDLKDLLKKSKSNKKPKRNKKAEFLGYLITTLGILAFILSLLINRFVDREYFSDATIIIFLGFSFLSIMFGFYILIKEIK